MTTRTADEARVRQRVIKERGIKFLDDVESDQWPKTHLKTFQHIRTLGSTCFSSWTEEVRADWQDAPWKLDTQNRARAVFQGARRCRDQDVNERVWRSRLEPFIFQRLDNDILWYAKKFELIAVIF
jgi:hypothetical protein